MQIYDENGYVDIRKILGLNIPFTIVVGGRATGKTYTTLKTVIEDKITFMYMRRLQSQCDLINKQEFSPFKVLNADMHWHIGSMPISKYNAGFYNMILSGEEVGKYVAEGQPLGYSCALSTISNMRGFDASDVKLLIYDEFIHEKHERDLRNEGDAFLNAYETMNRNRELKGIAPIQMVCLANANDITNPVFESLKLIRIADKMQKGNSDRWTDDKRGIQLIMLHRSPISRKKSNTALYNLTDGSDFANMALDTDFNVDRQHVRPRPLSEFTPICSIGELCIYRHKSENRLYATTHLSGVFNKTYSLSETDRLHYQRIYRNHWDMYISGKIDFEDVLSEKMFIKYWDI